MVELKIGDCVIQVVQGDITKETTDAIVNAANRTLLGGGGVDGAIHRAGGPEILEQCKKLGGCETGDAKITTGGRLPAKYVIHTVGPIYRDGKHGEPELLRNCYIRSLEVAVEHGIKTVAFPAISCGVYGYPIPEAAKIAITTVKEFVEKNPHFKLVRFVMFGSDTYGPYCEVLKSLGGVEI
ncbi:MAG: O-acetyl-ADP-ribose deacetylase [Candidatus Hydrogenedentes bacterium]|nr:O-acetyl-ADP-ribose deacetylase [Candidatus Hydrogenedentota bacterium]